ELLAAPQLQHVVSEMPLRIIHEAAFRRVLAEPERLAHQHQFAVTINDAGARAEWFSDEPERAFVGFKQLAEQFLVINPALTDLLARADKPRRLSRQRV